MLAKYYRSKLLIILLSLVALITTCAYFIWYQNFTVPRAPHWLTLLILYLLAAAPVFLPNKTLSLPELLPPVILFLGLTSVNATLTAISHSVTFHNLSWPMMGYTLLALGLILRRHTFWGWAFYTGFILLVLNWHTRYFDSRMSLLTEFSIPLLLMVIAMLVPRQIDQAVYKTRKAHGMRDLADAGRIEEAGMGAIASQRVQEVRALTEEMLHRIAYDPRPVNTDEVDLFRFTEAQLRDTIRGRYIVNQKILHAAWGARQRGVRVDILDERGSALPTRLANILTVYAVDLFQRADGGTVTIRAFPQDDSCAVMLVHDGNSEGDEPSAIEISQTGQVERF